MVEHGWRATTAARIFLVAPRTARKWVIRYRDEGAAGMVGRSSRRQHSPTRHLEYSCAGSRPCGSTSGSDRHRSVAGSPPPRAVLTRCRINPRIDRVTGEPLRRCEHDHPGSLIHVDVTKFGNIPTAAAGATSANRGQTPHTDRAPHRATRPTP
ncbi:hypothetical protein I6J71_39870 [Amycolatopsis sp. FDAARGOS 1241]|nr:hypothetical protein I6J71_39870 [Amycolatopsis sp. FDAARGOS 1241]